MLQYLWMLTLGLLLRCMCLCMAWLSRTSCLQRKCQEPLFANTVWPCVQVINLQQYVQNPGRVPIIRHTSSVSALSTFPLTHLM